MSIQRRCRGLGWSLALALASMSVACGGGSNPCGAAGTGGGAGKDGGAGTGGGAGTDGGAGVDGGAGTDGGAGVDGGSGPATALEFCTAFRDLSGDYAARCNGGTKADWIAYAESFVSCEEFAHRIGTNRVTYHRELAQACLQAFGSQRACGLADDLCFARVLEGKAAYGQACHSDYDCPAEGVCWAETEINYDACIPSVCSKVPTSAGEACGAFGFCVGATCLNDVCVANGKLGADCGGGLPLCDGDLTCDLTAQKCVARGGEGMVCVQDTDCLTALACISGTCKPRLAIGASCLLGADTACTGFTACNPASGVCEAAGHVGQQCAGSEGSFLFCTNGTCRRNASGVPTCFAKGEIGAACRTGDECVSEGCKNGKCTACVSI